MNRKLVTTTIHGAIFLGLALLGLATDVYGAKAKSKTAAAAKQVAQLGSVAGDEEAQKRETINCDWLPFPDNTKFKVLGLHWFEENQPQLWRMPKGPFDSLPNGVKRQSKHPSGGRIHLIGNTSKLVLKVLPLAKGNLKGFDVYINGRFYRSAVAEEPDVETDLVLFADFDDKEKEIMVYLPYHQEIIIKAVGVDKGARFSRPEHQFARPLPMVFYGSSVCQGSGALKPGMTYEAILARELNLDFVNLGFGGAGKAETNVVDLVNSIPACCYVFDLGKSYGMQDKTAFRDMLKTVRKSHPSTPILCLTPITSALEVHSVSYTGRSMHTRTVMRDAVNDLNKSGEKNLYLIEGEDLLGFNEHDGLSKDGLHPTDYGYSIIAKRLLPVLKEALGM